jgi:signal transduction histidine kinase
VDLITQAALIASLYKSEVAARVTSTGTISDYGRQVNLPLPADEYFRPVKPQLNLFRDRIRSRPADAKGSALQADKIAQEVGAKLTPVLLDAQRTNLAGFRLLDAQGIVIGGRAELGKSLAHIREIRAALQGRYASALRERTIHRPQPALASISRGTGIRVFVAYPITVGDRLLGVIFLSRTPASILEHLYSQKETVALVAAIILLLVVLLVVVTSYSIARPLHSLIAQTKRFAGGDKKALEPLSAPVTEEVALLSQSFSEMAQSLEHRSEYIGNFAAHVSHEFKTPLTAIQGATELLEEHAHDMTPDQRARFLRNIAQDSERLKRLVNRLLEMARADVLAPAEGKCKIGAIVAKLRARYLEQGLIVSLVAESETMAKLPAEILETILTNLIDNSRQNGASRVEISVTVNDGDGYLSITDNGLGVSTSNRSKIFTPFFTTRRDQGGTGLGLGIVRALLRAYGGEISLQPSEKGAAFKVNFPTTEV